MRPVGVFVVSLAACHSVLAIDAPPRGTGKSVLVIRARGDVILGVDAGDATRELPNFGRRGDIDVAIVELKCTLAALELNAGEQELLATPYARSHLPVSAAIHTLEIRDGLASAWRPAAATEAWIDLGLRSVKAPDDLRCRVGQFDFEQVATAVEFPSSVVALADGDAVVLTANRIRRMTPDGRLTPLDLQLTRTPTTVFTTGIQSSDGELWVLDGNGQLAHGPLDGGEMTYVRSSSIGGADLLAFDARGGLYAARQANRERPTVVEHYDPISDRWTIVYRASSFGEIDLSMVGLDHSVLLAGADISIFGSRVRGGGRLLELEPGTEPRWIDLPKPTDVDRVMATSIADTQLYGRTIGGFTCPEQSDGTRCSDAANQRDIRATVLRELDGEWVPVPSLSNGLAVLGLRDGGPEALLMGTFLEGGPRGMFVIGAHFADDFLCQFEGVEDNSSTALVALGGGRFAVPNDVGHRHLIQLFVPRPVPPGCGDD